MRATPRAAAACMRRFDLLGCDSEEELVEECNQSEG